MFSAWAALWVIQNLARQPSWRVIKTFFVRSEWRGSEEMRSGVSVQGPQGGTALSSPEDSCRGETRQVSLHSLIIFCLFHHDSVIVPKGKTQPCTTQHLNAQLKKCLDVGQFFCLQIIYQSSGKINSVLALQRPGYAFIRLSMLMGRWLDAHCITRVFPGLIQR